MQKLHRLTREPALILGVVTAGLALLVLFGVDVSEEQIAGVGVFLGALMALVRFVTAPASEVLAQVKPDGAVVAGKASAAKTGTPLLDGRVDGTPGPALVQVPVDPDAP